MSLVPDHLNKANIVIMCIKRIFWFPTAYKSSIDTILQSIKCAIALYFEKMYISEFKNTS